MPFPAPLLLALTAADPGAAERGLAPAVGMSIFATSVWLGLVAAQKDHAPKKCRICTADAGEQAVRAAVAWKKPSLAATLSDVALGVTSAWSFGTLLISGAADHRLRAADPLL